MKLAPEMKSKIDSLWEEFWSGGMSNPLQSIEQMSYLIFMKRLEDMDALEINRAKARSNPYSSVFDGHEDCKWSVWKHYPADQMLSHVRDKVFPSSRTCTTGKNRYSPNR